MTKNIFLRWSVTSALLLSPIAASAQSTTSAMAGIANNAVATATSPVSESDRKVAPATPAEKKICKQLPSSYSRMTKRSCLTAKEWKQVEQDSQD
jgi:hypothetical protein